MKHILILDDTRKFQPHEGLELVHVRTVKEAIAALQSRPEWDELWLDHHLEWSHRGSYDPPFHSGARLALYLNRYVDKYRQLVVRVISDLDAHYIQEITDHLDDAEYTFTLNPDGEGLPTPHVRSY